MAVREIVAAGLAKLVIRLCDNLALDDAIAGWGMLFLDADPGSKSSCCRAVRRLLVVCEREETGVLHAHSKNVGRGVGEGVNFGDMLQQLRLLHLRIPRQGHGLLGVGSRKLKRLPHSIRRGGLKLISSADALAKQVVQHVEGNRRLV